MKLILVVGPSGSGKDTLLRAAREKFITPAELAFVSRYITRPPDGNEDNYYVDSFCFRILRENNFFASQWQAHGYEYGIPRHALENATNGQRLLCSISRSAINDFERIHSDVAVLHVTASIDILEKRLQGRGREKSKEIERRLKRAAQQVHAKNLITFDNSGTLEQSQEDFIHLLRSL